MSAINGTTISLYSNGICIAMQKGLTVAWDANLEDATNKQSAGWAEHLCGLMNAKIDFNALFSTGLLSDTPAVLSAKDLMDSILNSTSLLVSILGGPFPIVGKANLSSLSFDAPMEAAMTLSGSLKINGPLYPLTGAMIKLLSDLSVGGTDYTTFVLDSTGYGIASATNTTAGPVQSITNTMAVTSGDVIKLITYVTGTSFEAPFFSIIRQDTGASISGAAQQSVAGLNVLTFTITATTTGQLKITNTINTAFSTSPIYLFKA